MKVLLQIPVTLIILLICTVGLFGQDPARFKKEVIDIQTRTKEFNRKNLMLFTGSSSIRLWADVADRFPDANVLNTGFGGSEMSDLYYYADELILRLKPKRIFIYEGDNDLAQGESKEQILSDAEKLLKRLRCELPKRTKIYFITPKPSVLRWSLKSEYEDYIAALKQLCQSKKNVYCLDVWTPMIADGKANPSLFVEDNLHMNVRGYDIWTSVIRPYVK